MNILRFLTPKSRVCYLYDDATLRQGLEKMRFHHHHAIPVITRDGKYIGTVGEGEFLWEIYESGDADLHGLEHRMIRDILRKKDNPPVLNTAPVTDLLERVKVNAFVPVVDDRGCLIGIITRRDVINYFADDYLEKDKKIAKTSCNSETDVL